MTDVSERWLPIPGWERLYEASDLGRIRSLDRVIVCGNGTTQRRRGRVLAQSRNQEYLVVTLCRDGKPVTRTVHRLVGEAFLGPLPPGMETRHGPGGPFDNSVANLSYGTSKENAADKFRDGTHVQGADIPWAVLTEDIVRECRKRYAVGGVLIRTLAEEHGVSMQSMHEAVTGKTWRHVA